MTGKLLNNKKGYAVELMALVVIGIVCLVFFAGWKYAINTVNDELLAVSSPDNASNVSAATEATFSYMNTGLDYLGLISYMIIIGFAIATLIVAYFSGEHPILFFVYIFVIILIVIFAVYISNSYEDLLDEPVIGAELVEFETSNHIMSKLPLWVGVIGFIGTAL